MNGLLPVSAVVVNYNRRDVLVSCLDSLLGQTRKPAEIIVVDNGSDDGSADAVEEKYGDRVRLVRLSDNQGFAGGNNAGAEEAGSEWLALINNDAVADPCWLSMMVAAAGDDPEVGLVACRILRADHKDLLDNQGVGMWPDGMSRGMSHFSRAAEVAEENAFIPSGCALLVRRAAFFEAGGFDESFFAYSEDTDLFIKIRLLGYKCVFAPKAFVYHSGGGTLGVVSPLKIRLVERNRISILIRYYPILMIIFSPAYTLARYFGLFKNLFRAGLPKSGAQGGLIKSLAALLGAYLEGLSRIPADLRERRKWKGKSRVPPGSLGLWIRQHRLDSKSLSDLEPG